MLERLVFFVVVASAAIAPSFAHTAKATSTEHSEFPGFPEQFQAMRQLELSSDESRFAQDFPGKIGKFEQAGKQYVVRFITQPTRMLHPAADCFRASGFSIEPLARCIAPQADATACFVAESNDQRLLVSESISDTQGQQWSDVSAWCWATQTGATHGPWWSITTISRAQE